MPLNARRTQIHGFVISVVSICAETVAENEDPVDMVIAAAEVDTLGGMTGGSNVNKPGEVTAAGSKQ